MKYKIYKNGFLVAKRNRLPKAGASRVKFLYDKFGAGYYDIISKPKGSIDIDKRKYKLRKKKSARRVCKRS